MTDNSSIRIKCSCGKQLKAKRSLAGKRVKCPACGAAVQISKEIEHSAKIRRQNSAKPVDTNDLPATESASQSPAWVPDLPSRRPQLSQESVKPQASGVGSVQNTSHSTTDSDSSFSNAESSPPTEKSAGRFALLSLYSVLAVFVVAVLPATACILCWTYFRLHASNSGYHHDILQGVGMYVVWSVGVCVAGVSALLYRFYHHWSLLRSPFSKWTLVLASGFTSFLPFVLGALSILGALSDHFAYFLCLGTIPSLMLMANALILYAWRPIWQAPAGRIKKRDYILVGLAVAIPVIFFSFCTVVYRSDYASLTRIGGYIHLHNSWDNNSGYTSVKLSDTQVTDNDLIRLQGFEKIGRVELCNTIISDAGLAHLRKCDELRGLDLRNTKVTDAGMGHLQGLTQLHSLDISGTSITDAGIGRLKRLPGIWNLDLRETKISDAGMEELAQMPKLSVLHLDGTSITDAGLSHLEKLPRLSALGIRNTQVTGAGIQRLRAALPDCTVWASQATSEADGSNRSQRTIGSIAGEANRNQGRQPSNETNSDAKEAIAAIRKMGGRIGPFFSPLAAEADTGGYSVSLVSASGVTDADLEQLKAIRGLKELSLNGTAISDGGLVHLEGLSDLHTLELAGTQLSDAGMERLKMLESLRILDIGNAQVSDTGLEGIERLTNLQRLMLRGTKITDAGLEHLEGLPSLEYLDLSSTNVSDASQLRGLKNLEGLSLTGTDIGDAGLKHLEEMTNLQDLDASRTRVSDSGMEHLNALTNLYSLRLNGTNVSDAGLEHLNGLSHLHHLYLGETNVSGGGLEHLKGLSNLHSLDLRETNVSNAGLEHLKALTNLSSLHLYGTNVTDAGVEDLQAALPDCRIVR